MQVVPLRVLHERCRPSVHVPRRAGPPSVVLGFRRAQAPGARAARFRVRSQGPSFGLSPDTTLLDQPGGALQLGLFFPTLGLQGHVLLLQGEEIDTNVQASETGPSLGFTADGSISSAQPDGISEERPAGFNQVDIATPVVDPTFRGHCLPPNLAGFRNDVPEGAFVPGTGTWLSFSMPFRP